MRNYIDIINENSIANFVPDVGTIVEYDAGYGFGNKTYRVTGWLKKYTPPKRSEDDWVASILDQSSRELGPDSTKLIHCARKEAEYLSLVGVGGQIAPINKVKVVGKVNWSDNLIDDERKQANARIGHVVA